MSIKVGIITLHKNTNYGANLQAFASSAFVKNLGFDCILIDYFNDEQRKKSKVFSWLKLSWEKEKNKSFSRKIKLGLALALSIPWKQKRLNRFAKFRKKFISLTGECHSERDVEKLSLDTIVCGSDQIWNPNITEGINPIFFGAIDGVKKRISYAASVGKNKLYEQDELKIKDLIGKLDYCSVREEQTASYLSSLTNKNIETVCDPVFLLNREDYERIATKRLIKKDYVLLYSVVHNDELTKIAVDYAKKHNLQLIEICAGKDKSVKHKQILTYGPSEFISAIRYAKTVFTNSFHGTAFSLIFEKDFYIVDNKNGGSRIKNILEKAGCLERLIENPVEKNFTTIDYLAVKQRLSSYVDFSKDFLIKSLKSKKDFLANDKCVGCGACKTVCKFDAIRLIKDNEGFLQSTIDQSKCVNCGLCKKVCPALNQVVKNQKASKVFAFKGENETRIKSTSGGAFAEIAKAIVKIGGVFYGASQREDFSVKHIRGESLEDISKIQGTKYLQSDIFRCYDLLEKDLKDGKTVLFSGTPCQVDAITRFVALKKLPSNQLYTVDIICHGVPSQTIYKDYLKWLENEHKSKVVEYSFRDKRISWRGSSCYAKLENGKILLNDKKLCAFMTLYYSNYITRNCCYHCKYTSQERVSDITISDYWGIEKVDKNFEDNLGVSMILINTEKGEKLFGQTQGESIIANVEKAIQPQLSKPTKRPIDRDEFWETYKAKGLEPLLKKHGGVKANSLKTKLYRLKQKILK